MSHLDKKPSPGVNVPSCKVSSLIAKNYGLGDDTDKQTNKQTNEVLYNRDAYVFKYIS